MYNGAFFLIFFIRKFYRINLRFINCLQIHQSVNLLNKIPIWPEIKCQNNLFFFLRIKFISFLDWKEKMPILSETHQIG